MTSAAWRKELFPLFVPFGLQPVKHPQLSKGGSAQGSRMLENVTRLKLGSEAQWAAEALPAEPSLPARAAPSPETLRAQGSCPPGAAVPLVNWAAEAVEPGTLSLQMRRCSWLEPLVPHPSLQWQSPWISQRGSRQRHPGVPALRLQDAQPACTSRDPGCETTTQVPQEAAPARHQQSPRRANGTWEMLRTEAAEAGRRPLSNVSRGSSGCCLVAQSVGLWDSLNYSPSDSSVHGILQAVLEWVAISCSRGSPQPRDWTLSPALAAQVKRDQKPVEPLTRKQTKGVSFLTYWIILSQ